MLVPAGEIAGGVLLGVIALVIARPRKLSVAWPAGVGAIVAIVAGLLSLPALVSIFGATWDAAGTLIALFILSETLASNGFFRWAALHLARLGRGSGWRLYGLILLLTTGVTALLANDGAVLMLTPIFAVLLAKIFPHEDARLPYLFAAGFFADAMSGLLIPSNLTNIIVADANRLSFARTAAALLLPTLCAFLAAGVCFAVRFRSRLALPYDASRLEAPASALSDRWLFKAGWVAFAVLVAGYFAGGELHLPVSLVAGPVALAMLALTHLRGRRTVWDVLVVAPWDILIYALGMFAVITAAFNAGTLAPLVGVLRHAAHPASGIGGMLLAGGLLAGVSAAANNLPAALIGVLALHGVTPVANVALYAILLGVDIGPKLTPYGSLATLLWLGILKRNGVSISWGRYVRENWWVALVALAAALGGLALEHALLGV